MLQRRQRDLCLLLVLAVFVTACHPTAPSCTDAEGRGSSAPDTIVITCAPNGADVQCTAVGTNTDGLYVYCPVTFDWTDQVMWIATDPAADFAHPGAPTDPSVAAFGRPGTPAGFLKVSGAGRVQITASFGFLSSNTYAFAVAPGVTAERLATLYVNASDARTSAALSGVQVDVHPDRGGPQACVTNQFGGCVGTLWVLTGSVQIHGAKAGYQDAQTSVTFTPGNLSQGINLKLTPQP